MKKSSQSLTLLSFLLLCFVALYGPSTQAAVLPSNRNVDTMKRDQIAAALDSRREQQQTFNVETECDEEEGSSSTSSTKSTSTAKTTSTSHSSSSSHSSTKSTSSSTKTTSTSTRATSTSTKAASTTSSTKTTSTSVSKTSTITSASATATGIVLTSNNVTYGEDELMADLNTVLKWAEDQSQTTADLKDEIVAALLSASARYYPEMPTEVICRIMLGDIRQESDFNASEISGARLDSGSSWGLLQVSPGGASEELVLFQDHANVLTHNFTYGMPDDVRAAIRGPLLDYATGEMINMTALTNDDLFRPWINIHVAMWIQSNLARTSSQDPYNWKAINDYSWQLKTGVLSTSSSTVASKWQKLLAGASLPINIRTGLGSWVAGPATDGGGYLTSGDDISSSYLNWIMKAVRVLYGVTTITDMPKTWLETYTLNAGLVDYV